MTTTTNSPVPDDFSETGPDVPTSLTELDRKVHQHVPRATAIDLFRELRHRWFREVASGFSSALIKTVGTEPPPPPALSASDRSVLATLAQNWSLSWPDWSGFHQRYRVRTIDDLKASLLVPPEAADTLRPVIATGYKLSILPLNILLPREVSDKFIPGPDYFESHPAANPDPYGLASALVKSDDHHAARIPIGHQKFPHTLLVNVTTTCTIGCVGCYKSLWVRESGTPYGTDEDSILMQMRSVVRWLNDHPDVYDVIISGGEPLLNSNGRIHAMLDELKRARHLRILRICTGTLFQGLAFRFDDDLTNALRSFEDETGRRITINAHLSSHFQITPEAILAVRKLRRSGFTILSQVPIQEGVNFFRDDMEKTLRHLLELGRRQATAGIEPYKMIVDMHPRTQARYVPIEPLCIVWSHLAESHRYPEVARPRTLSILFDDGNIVLSGHLLASMRKHVDVTNRVVTYTIPGSYAVDDIRNPRIERWLTYREPLVGGVNDDPTSLERLRARIAPGDQGQPHGW